MSAPDEIAVTDLAKSLVKASIPHKTDIDEVWDGMNQASKNLYLKRARNLILDGWTKP